MSKASVELLSSLSSASNKFSSNIHNNSFSFKNMSYRAPKNKSAHVFEKMPIHFASRQKWLRSCALSTLICSSFAIIAVVPSVVLSQSSYSDGYESWRPAYLSVPGSGYGGRSNERPYQQQPLIYEKQLFSQLAGTPSFLTSLPLASGSGTSRFFFQPSSYRTITGTSDFGGSAIKKAEKEAINGTKTTDNKAEMDKRDGNGNKEVKRSYKNSGRYHFIDFADTSI